MELAPHCKRSCVRFCMCFACGVKRVLFQHDLDSRPMDVFLYTNGPRLFDTLPSLRHRR